MGKKKLFISSFFFFWWKWEGSGEYDFVGNRVDSFENYFGFGFVCVYIYGDSFIYGNSGVMEEELLSMIVKVKKGFRVVLVFLR